MSGLELWFWWMRLEPSEGLVASRSLFCPELFLRGWNWNGSATRGSSGPSHAGGRTSPQLVGVCVCACSYCMRNH